MDWEGVEGNVFNDGVESGGWGLVVEDSLFFAAAGGWRVAELQSGAPPLISCYAGRQQARDRHQHQRLFSTRQVLRYFTECCTTLL